MPASRLHAADLDNSLTTAAPAGPPPHARTEPAAMGQVTAFLSHSWSDEDEAPGAKHAIVSLWAKRRHEATGIEPTLWLVWRSHYIALHPGPSHISHASPFPSVQAPTLTACTAPSLSTSRARQTTIVV